MPEMKFEVINPGSPEPIPPGGILRTTFPVGHRFRCTMTMDVSSLDTGPTTGELTVQWKPCLPKRLSAAEWRDYRAGRDAFFRRTASVAGQQVGVVELAEDASPNSQSAHVGGQFLGIER